VEKMMIKKQVATLQHRKKPGIPGFFVGSMTAGPNQIEMLYYWRLKTFSGGGYGKNRNY
jgi:hypothetical protein